MAGFERAELEDIAIGETVDKAHGDEVVVGPANARVVEEGRAASLQLGMRRGRLGGPFVGEKVESSGPRGRDQRSA